MLPEILPPPPLTLLLLRLTYQAAEPLVLPRWKGALLRGGLGRALKAALCDPACREGRPCSRAANCAYRAVFAPEAEEGASDLQGLRDAPRPYAVLPPLGDQTHYAPGDRLVFDLMLAGRAQTYLPHILFAFETLGAQGLGLRRGRAVLVAATSYSPLTGRHAPLLVDGVLQNQWITVSGADLVAAAQALPPQITLQFITPLRMKYNGQLVTSAECHVLVRTALRRISTLCTTFGTGAWPLPFSAVIAAAQAVPRVQSHTQWVDWSRTSGATGQHMTLGGLVGQATYQDVPPLVRLVLLTGALTHIGKAVVFGHGAYRMQAHTQPLVVHDSAYNYLG